MSNDVIEKDKPNTASSMHMTVIPSSDGIYLFKAKAKAAGNGQPSPAIWLQIVVNGTTLKTTGEVGWADGVHTVEISAAEPVKAGTIYDVLAISGNRNADAQGVEIDGRRA
ncbi:hypothetical protein LNV47_01585 [Paucibacter sp. DJ4R-1]|nr:hypothetical protein [Paucibacter sp. DJ4R-1]